METTILGLRFFAVLQNASGRVEASQAPVSGFFPDDK